MKTLGDDQYEVLFQYQAQAGTKAVYLAGTFNNWNRMQTKMDGPDDQESVRPSSC